MLRSIEALLDQMEIAYMEISDQKSETLRRFQPLDECYPDYDLVHKINQGIPTRT